MTVPDETTGTGPLGVAKTTGDRLAPWFDGTFCEIVVGRRAARVWADWSRRLGLNETDLQLLWGLERAAPERLDQSTLATRLAISPAQVSVTVERLRASGWIGQSHSVADRRRNLWQLTAEGRQVIAGTLDELTRWAAVPHATAPRSADSISGASTREEAA